MTHGSEIGAENGLLFLELCHVNLLFSFTIRPISFFCRQT